MTKDEARQLRIGDTVRVDVGAGPLRGRLESLEWNGITGTALVSIGGIPLYFDIHFLRKETQS